MVEFTLPETAKVVAFVHAKGTSERVPGKNLRTLGDRPLICHAIANALAAKLVDAVVIDSEDDEILRVGEEAGAVPLKRPVELASNKVTGDDLAGWQADNAPDADIIAQVVPTSPFILPQSIDQAVDSCRDVTSVICVRKEKLYRYDGSQRVHSCASQIPNSQDIDLTVWDTTGLYVVQQSYAKAKRRRESPGNKRYIPLTKIQSIDINTEEDFHFAEIVWRGMQDSPVSPGKYECDMLILPGATISEVMESHGMETAELGVLLEMDQAGVIEIIQGKQRITGKIACDLSVAFGMPSIFWLQLEANYRDSLERLQP